MNLLREDGGDKILEPICGLFSFGQALQINKLLSVEGTEMLYQYAVSCIKENQYFAQLATVAGQEMGHSS
jgi:hypothetical protein